MSSSANEDREQSNTINMEESNLMTIEFLRARLLSERTVSKTARQRAGELAKRVAELEEQLKFVSLQRKKAERATADVLAILENHGISDVSEEFDSCSEQGESPEEFKAHNGSLMSKDTSTNIKLRNNEKEVYSSSEVESSPSTGRSLSWRNTKDSQHSLEKKKYMDSVRRRASFSSNSSSMRRIGKSCRRIRRRETRSMDDIQNDGSEKAMCSGDASNCSDGEPVALAESSDYANGKNPLENSALGPISGTQKVNSHYFSVHEKDEAMESALQHQAQLIGQFEEEEKAQREWEEKFRENNSGTPDSFDPGNHSDVTEERYETKSPELSCTAATLDSDNQETKQEPADARVGEEPPTSKSLPSITDADKGSLPDEKCSSGINPCESPASEFSFPMSEKSDQQFSSKQHEPSTHRHQQYLPTIGTNTHSPAKISPSYVGRNTPLSSASPGTSASFELAVVPRGTSNSLGSVLEALQQAKLSLNQKLGSLPQVAGGTSVNITKPSNPETNKVDRFQIPFSTPGLFRLPTDIQFEATTRANSGANLPPSFANHLPPGIAPRKILSYPFVESRNAFSGNPFLTVPNRPFTPETRPGFPPQRSLSQPRLSEAPMPSNRINHLNPYTNSVFPHIKDSYPFIPDVTLRLPSNEEVASRNFPSSERGLPPVMHLSSYDERTGPNTYR